MNLTQPYIGTLPKVFEYVCMVAKELKCEAVQSEIIGAIPLLTLEGVTPESILWYDFRQSQIIENWLPFQGDPIETKIA